MRAALIAISCLGCTVNQPTPDHHVQPIVNGTPDPARDQVVALVGAGGVYCSGTLIAPRFVVTAAHCLGPTPPGVLFGAVPSSPLASVATLDFRAHPDFDPVALTDDVAVLYLGGPAPADVEPARLPAASLGPLQGGPVLVVGYGAGDAAGPAERRQGTARVDSLTAGELLLLPDPAQPCHGDSGGAVFADVDGAPALVGVISHGDAACTAWSAAARLDAAAEFVTRAMDEMGVTDQPLGARCVEDAECASAACLFPDDAPSVGYCTLACGGDGDCARDDDGLGPMACDAGDGLCRYPLPSPGALGTACDIDADCDRRLCASGPDGPPTCSITCLPGYEASCPAPLSCVERGDGPGYVCVPPEVPAQAGCSAAGDAGRAPPFPAVFLVWLLGRRMVRRRAAATSTTRRQP